MSQIEQAFMTVLNTLSQATLAVVKADKLDPVLQQIADTARELVGAQYAAIGIPNDENLLEVFVFSGMDAETVARMPSLPRGLGLLGVILHAGKTVRVTCIADDPRSIGFPPGHPPMDSFLGTPIMIEGEIAGNLYLTNKIGAAAFSALDEKLVEVLATHAAVAIKKAQLLQSSQERGHQLKVLNQAAVSIATEFALDKVLQQIVDSLRILVRAEYAALGVPAADGGLEAFVHSGLTADQTAKIGHSPEGRGVLGKLLRQKKPIRIPDVTFDPHSVGFPEGHPPMTPFLGVPIVAGEEMLGSLYVTNKIGADLFSAADQELIELLAAHAAVAIQNARLYEQVGRLAVTEERTRIGMDLHDGVIQSIYAVGLTLESTRLAMMDNPEEANQLLTDAIDGLNSTIRDIRNFILDLRPHRFQGDLKQGMARLVREFQANAMVAVDLAAAPEAWTGLPPVVSRTLFLTTQEALANVARHARANSVKIEVTRRETAVQLRIVDDGRGFDPTAQLQTVGHGLSNMQARAESLKGSFSVQSKPGEGTTITLRLPC